MREAIAKLDEDRRNWLHNVGLELEREFNQPATTSAKPLDTRAMLTDNTVALNA